MAGRKVFTSGEILTAADVNSFLMNQVVAVFADDDARSSAIPSPLEGMVTFREDQDVVEVFDGSAFKTVGGLVAVESVLKTDTFSASVTGGNNVAVTDLSITHEVSDPANKLIISAFFGVAASSDGRGNVALALAEDGTLIAVGTSTGSRVAVTAGGRVADSGNALVGLPIAASFVHTPGAGSKTYTVRAVNYAGSNETLFINRIQSDTDALARPRAVSSIVIQEVAV